MNNDSLYIPYNSNLVHKQPINPDGNTVDIVQDVIKENVYNNKVRKGVPLWLFVIIIIFLLIFGFILGFLILYVRNEPEGTNTTANEITNEITLVSPQPITIQNMWDKLEDARVNIISPKASFILQPFEVYLNAKITPNTVINVNGSRNGITYNFKYTFVGIETSLFLTPRGIFENNDYVAGAFTLATRISTADTIYSDDIYQNIYPLTTIRATNIFGKRIPWGASTDQGFNRTTNSQIVTTVPSGTTATAFVAVGGGSGRGICCSGDVICDGAITIVCPP